MHGEFALTIREGLCAYIGTIVAIFYTNRSFMTQIDALELKIKQVLVDPNVQMMTDNNGISTTGISMTR